MMLDVVEALAVVSRMIATIIAIGNLDYFWFFTLFGGVTFATFYTSRSEIAIGRGVAELLTIKTLHGV